MGWDGIDLRQYVLCVYVSLGECDIHYVMLSCNVMVRSSLTSWLLMMVVMITMIMMMVFG